eukprot:TRINITY_DN11061_c0_g1_i4.p1 TRINITY_DN11061_c0_g1~~TRINITY_DN11061_c0_g1_i4.p1  ORF type:complete len:694 (+),score=112.75 TRINITY_DN11061_c0_g1_i4:149-2230(+)
MESRRPVSAYLFVDAWGVVDLHSIMAVPTALTALALIEPEQLPPTLAACRCYILSRGLERLDLSLRMWKQLLSDAFVIDKRTVGDIFQLGFQTLSTEAEHISWWEHLLSTTCDATLLQRCYKDCWKRARKGSLPSMRLCLRAMLSLAHLDVLADNVDKAADRLLSLLGISPSDIELVVSLELITSYNKLIQDVRTDRRDELMLTIQLPLIGVIGNLMINKETPIVLQHVERTCCLLPLPIIDHWQLHVLKADSATARSMPTANSMSATIAKLYKSAFPAGQTYSDEIYVYAITMLRGLPIKDASLAMQFLVQARNTGPSKQLIQLKSLVECEMNGWQSWPTTPAQHMSAEWAYNCTLHLLERGDDDGCRESDEESSGDHTETDFQDQGDSNMAKNSHEPNATDNADGNGQHEHGNMQNRDGSEIGSGVEEAISPDNNVEDISDDESDVEDKLLGPIAAWLQTSRADSLTVLRLLQRQLLSALRTSSGIAQDPHAWGCYMLVLMLCDEATSADWDLLLSTAVYNNHMTQTGRYIFWSRLLHFAPSFVDQANVLRLLSDCITMLPASELAIATSLHAKTALRLLRSEPGLATYKLLRQYQGSSLLWDLSLVMALIKLDAWQEAERLLVEVTSKHVHSNVAWRWMLAWFSQQDDLKLTRWLCDRAGLYLPFDTTIHDIKVRDVYGALSIMVDGHLA